MIFSTHRGTFLEKQLELKKMFSCCPSAEKRYEKIIELSKLLQPYPEALKLKENVVSGCQSIMYLHASLEEGKMRFHAHSEALISAGLAALLLFIYDGETPEVLLISPPLFLEEWGIPSILSPGRSNGLASLFKTMQKHAINFLNQK